MKREVVAALQSPLVTAYRRSICGGFFAEAVFVGSVFPTCVLGVTDALPAKRDWETPMAIVASNNKAVAVKFRIIVSIYTQIDIESVTYILKQVYIEQRAMSSC